MNLKQNSTLALVILIISTYIHSHIQYYHWQMYFSQLKTFVSTFSTGFPPHQVSCPNPDRTCIYIFISCRYLIPSDWNFSKRLLQNLLITNNAWVFWKVYFWAVSLLMCQNGLESGKAVDITSEYVLCFNIWVFYLCTFNSLPLFLKWAMTLVGTT